MYIKIRSYVATAIGYSCLCETRNLFNRAGAERLWAAGWLHQDCKSKRKTCEFVRLGCILRGKIVHATTTTRERNANVELILTVSRIFTCQTTTTFLVDVNENVALGIGFYLCLQNVKNPSATRSQSVLGLSSAFFLLTFSSGVVV